VDGPAHLEASQRIKQAGGEDPRVLPAGTTALGLKAFLASLSILFVATLCSFWIVRGQADFWSQGLPGVPVGMWASTIILVLLSATSELACRNYAHSQEAYRRWFTISFVLAIGFILSQFLNWQELYRLKLTPKAKSLYSFSFYMLTGLHAIHVIGGLVWHSLALAKVSKGKGSAEVLRNTAVYWHFLGLCWVVLFGSLLLSANDDLSGAQIVNACWWITGFSTLMFVLCWLRAVIAIHRLEGAAMATLSLIPIVAFLRAFMAADETRMRSTLAWWTIWFGLILVGLSIGFAIKFHVEAV
jgi:cytochrome c oxidase subunit III